MDYNTRFEILGFLVAAAERSEIGGDRKVCATVNARRGGVVWPSIVDACFGLGCSENPGFDCSRPCGLEKSQLSHILETVSTRRLSQRILVCGRANVI
jgi:hypothetical protein